MKELEKEFKGKGEVSIYNFKQLFGNEQGYLYEVSDEFGASHYEVFKKKENTQFGCVSYPKSNSFGIWAWTYSDYTKALEKYHSIIEENTKSGTVLSKTKESSTTEIKQ